MRVQIIPSKDQKFLREFYGCYLWKIYNVIKVVTRRPNYRCKIQLEWKEYYIEVTHTYPHNHFGQKTQIRLKETDCKVLET